MTLSNLSEKYQFLFTHKTPIIYSERIQEDSNSYKMSQTQKSQSFRNKHPDKSIVKIVIGYVNYILNFKRTRIKKLFQLTDSYVLRSLLAFLDINSTDLSIHRILFRVSKNAQKTKTP